MTWRAVPENLRVNGPNRKPNVKTDGFWATFHDFKGSTRVVLVLSLLLGILALAVGLTLDVAKPKWLSGLNYLPNIWAGLTGFLIGAPFALVVLATYTVQREESAAQERINRLSKIAWQHFEDLCFAFCDPERMNATGYEAHLVEKAYKELYSAIVDSSNNLRFPLAASDTSIAVKLANVRNCIRPLFAAMHPITNTIQDAQTVATDWSAIVGAWNVLDQYVRLQRMERNLAWIEPSIDSELRMWMSRPNAVERFAEIHGYTRNHPSMHVSEWTPDYEYKKISMYDAAASVDRYLHMNDEKLKLTLMESSNYFTRSYVADYLTRANEASELFKGVLSCIRRVNHLNWPASANEAQAN